MLDIAEVVRRTGVPASALRYYEQRGLIASLGSPGQRRRFADSVTDRLALIALGQAAGLSLEEIGAMILPSGAPDIDRALLAARADQIDAQIKRLAAVSRGLRHAAVCPAPDHSACPKFQKQLRAATRGSLQRASKRVSQP